MICTYRYNCMHSYAIGCKLVRIAKGNVAERAALLASGALARFWVPPDPPCAQTLSSLTHCPRHTPSCSAQLVPTLRCLAECAR